MSLKWKEIAVLAQESKMILKGSIVQKIFQIDGLANNQSILLQGFHYEKGPWRLWISAMKENTYWVLVPEEFKAQATKKPSDFIMSMRKFLIGKKIEAISTLEGDRVLLMEFQEGYVLDVELIPKAPNVVLMKTLSESEKKGVYINSFHRVSLEKGGKYALPEPPKTIFEGSTEEIFEKYNGVKLHYEISKRFIESVEESDFSRLKKMYRTNAKSYIKKIQSALKNAEAEYENAKTAEQHLKKGKILSANLYKLGPNDLPEENRIQLDGEEIKLDPKVSYSENAQMIFKKAKKLGKANETTGDRLKEIRDKFFSLEEISKKIELSEKIDDLLTLNASLKLNGIEVPDLSFDKKNINHEPKEYLSFRSSDGFVIYCGRNQEENRRVTFRLAKGNDLWMHVRGVPGSHVIIKSKKGKTFPLSTLLQAAQICVFYSKVKRDKKVEVDYTLKKYVRSIKGTLAEVSYTENKTLLVSLEADFMKNLRANN